MNNYYHLSNKISFLETIFPDTRVDVGYNFSFEIVQLVCSFSCHQMYRMLALITRHVHEHYHFYLHLLANVYPLINPVLYVAFNKGYRTAVRKLLEKFCCCFSESFRKISQSTSVSLSEFS